MDEGSRIASVEEVPEDSTFLFRMRETGADEDAEEREAILVALADGVACWLNYCQHFTHIKLDKGSGAEMRNGEILCTNHGAYFEEDSGLCTYGPCEGAYLREVDVTVSDGAVYLTDEDYTFVGVGAVETDATDLGSKSNFEF